MEQIVVQKVQASHVDVIAHQALRMRRFIVDMVFQAKAAHLGSALSCVDILATLYHGIVDVEKIKAGHAARDYILLSKGHAATALYAGLISAGIMPEQAVREYAQKHSGLCGHPVKDAYVGIEASTGSLGQGLSMGVGIALACKHDGLHNNVYVVLGDGECQEGSVWEAAMFAPRYHLSNLVVIVDANQLQGIDRTCDVMPGDLIKKFQAFGWQGCAVDGHNYADLHAAITAPAQAPRVIVAHTIKGKGLAFAQDKLEWHYKSLTPELYEQAMYMLGGV